MKLIKLLVILLQLYLILSAELKINNSRKNNKSSSLNSSTKKSGTENYFTKSHTKTCPGGWKYFLGGILYNGTIDVATNSGIFGNRNIEQCVDNVLGTLWNLMNSYKELEKKELQKGSIIGTCVNSICMTAKICSKMALTGLICYITEGNVQPLEAYNLSSTLVDLTLSKLDEFWRKKAKAFVLPVIRFFEVVNFSEILSSLYACFGRERIWSFFAQMGVQLLEYYSDGPLAQIGQAVLSGADTVLNAYQTASDHPIVGPAMEVASWITPGAGPLKLAKAATMVGKVGLKKAAVKLFTKKAASKGLFKLGIRHIKKLAKISKKLVSLATTMGSETGYLIYNLGRDITNLVSELDDCKRWTLWGKVIYKGFRLTKIIYVGPGSSSVSEHNLPDDAFTDEEKTWEMAMESDPFSNGRK